MKQLVTKKTLAKTLQIHPNTVGNLTKKGVIQAIHIGTGTVRYDASEILNNLKAQSRERIK
jgi:hypothetical protein